MATYPPIMGAKASAKRHKMNQIYGNSTTAVTPVRKYQAKGPNMFKRMIKSLVTWSMTENHRHQEEVAISEDTCRISTIGIRFEVYRANGGTVIETRRNDRRTGDSIYELHVVAGDQDIGEEIGKIITMEALKS
jgi:hypothetical protein